jgi:hypothetical protein
MRELIKFIFDYEGEIRYAVFEKRFDSCVPKTGGGNGHSKVSDPTAQKALQNVMPVDVVLIEYGASINGKRETQKIRYPERWLRIIDETYKFFDKKKRSYTVRERLMEERRALKRKDSATSRFEIIEKTQMKLEVGHSPDFIEGLLMIEYLFKKKTGVVRRGFENW